MFVLPSAHLKVSLQASPLNEGKRSFMQTCSESHSITRVCIFTHRNRHHGAKNADDLIKAEKPDESVFIEEMIL